jgi:hypothetical protein
MSPIDPGKRSWHPRSSVSQSSASYARQSLVRSAGNRAETSGRRGRERHQAVPPGQTGFRFTPASRDGPPGGYRT